MGDHFQSSTKLELELSINQPTKKHLKMSCYFNIVINKLNISDHCFIRFAKHIAFTRNTLKSLIFDLEMILYIFITLTLLFLLFKRRPSEWSSAHPPNPKVIPFLGRFGNGILRSSRASNVGTISHSRS